MVLKKSNYFLTFCYFFMMMGVIMGLNSMSWLMMWISMEITLMFFIPCLLTNDSMVESFSSLKYFIFQCLGSIFFILGSLDFFFFNTFGLFLKLGIFPNHFWMFMVSKSLKWKNFFFLLTIQKILPLMFLVLTLDLIMFIYMFLIFINSIVGNMGSLNQMDLRFLMVFSSMNHMSWMILSSKFNMFYFYFYFLSYIILSMYMYMIFLNMNMYYLHQMFLKKNFNMNLNLFMISLIFFSFLGFPPLLGFFMKLMTIFSLMMMYMFMFMFFLLMQNLIISFSYLRVIIYMYMNLSRSMKMNKFFMKKYLFPFFILFMIFLF